MCLLTMCWCTRREAVVLHDAMREMVGEQDVLLAQLQAQLAQQQLEHQQQAQRRAEGRHQLPADASSAASSDAQGQEQLSRPQADRQPSAPQQVTGCCEAPQGTGRTALSTGSAPSEQPLTADLQQCHSSAQAGSDGRLGESPAAGSAAQTVPLHHHQQEYATQSLQGTVASASQPVAAPALSAEQQPNSQQLQAAASLQQEAGSRRQSYQQDAAQADLQEMQGPCPAALEQQPQQGSRPGADLPYSASAAPAAAAATAARAAARAVTSPTAVSPAVPTDAAAAVIRDLSARQAALAAQVHDLQDERQQLQVLCSNVTLMSNFQGKKLF